MLLFFPDDYHPQAVLLGLLQSRCLVSAPNNANFLLQYIFPLIPSKLGRNVLNSIMEDVLNQLPLIKREGYLPNIVSALKNLRFIKDKFGLFHRPSELYDPSIRELQQLFLDEPVFPVLPFSEDKYLFHLRDCGLRQSVQPQDIINIVSSIALPRAAVPQKVGTTKLSRARAVLKYIIAGCPPHLLQSQLPCQVIQELTHFNQPCSILPLINLGFQFVHPLQKATHKAWCGKVISTTLILLV